MVEIQDLYDRGLKTTKMQTELALKVQQALEGGGHRKELGAPLPRERKQGKTTGQSNVFNPKILKCRVQD